MHSRVERSSFTIDLSLTGRVKEARHDASKPPDVDRPGTQEYPARHLWPSFPKVPLLDGV
jgi:hypothetical protein